MAEKKRKKHGEYQSTEIMSSENLKIRIDFSCAGKVAFKNENHHLER